MHGALHEIKTSWEACSLADAKVLFIQVPAADGGYGDKVAKVTRSKGLVPDTNADPARVWCARQLLRMVAGQPLAEGLEAFEEDRCGVCGRTLTDPVSIERGIGPECYGRETGSEHETKVKRPPAQHQEQPPKRSDGKDKKGVAYGHGDWRARKDTLEEALKDNGAGPKPGARRLTQMTELPGETWEDIFADDERYYNSRTGEAKVS